MPRAAREIVTFSLRILVVLVALCFTKFIFADGTDYECDGTEDQCVTGSQDTAEGRYRKCVANGGDAKTCSQRTGYIGSQTIPGSTDNSSTVGSGEQGYIDYEESYSSDELETGDMCTTSSGERGVFQKGFIAPGVGGQPDIGWTIAQVIQRIPIQIV